MPVHFRGSPSPFDRDDSRMYRHHTSSMHVYHTSVEHSAFPPEAMSPVSGPRGRFVGRWHTNCMIQSVRTALTQPGCDRRHVPTFTAMYLLRMSEIALFVTVLVLFWGTILGNVLKSPYSIFGKASNFQFCRQANSRCGNKFTFLALSTVPIINLVFSKGDIQHERADYLHYSWK